ncbi:hypothetical protein ACVWY0_001101 [Arthrobacter sp. UYNi723]
MSKTPASSDHGAFPSSLRTAAGIATVFMLVLILVAFTVVPSFSPVHQSFLSGVIGSFAGSILAFLLAVVLWRIERAVLVAERAQDRADARRSEMERNDKNLLRECLGAANQLRALDYSVLKEDSSSTAREKYFTGLRISQAVSLIADNALRDEATFINSLTGRDEYLDHMVAGRATRLRTAATWFGRLVSLDPDVDVSEARPDNYADLQKLMSEYHDHKAEEAEMYDAHEREERERLAKEYASSMEHQGTDPGPATG